MMIPFSYLYTVAGVCFRRTHDGATEGLQPLGGVWKNMRRKNLIFCPY